MKTINQYITEHMFSGKKVNVQSQQNEKIYKSGSVNNIKDIEIGDILVTVFQYNSRHVHFWQVEKISGRATVFVKEVGYDVISGAYNSPAGAEIVPNLEKLGDKEIKCRLSTRGLKINREYAYFWNGKPENIYCD